MTSAAIYFRGEDASLADAADALRSQGLAPTVDGDRVIVGWDFRDRPHRFVVTRVESTQVSADALALGDVEQWGTALRRLDARFEIAIDDLEAALDEINTLIMVEAALLDLTRGFQYTPWNGRFLHHTEMA